jgi:hypothetical protein
VFQILAIIQPQCLSWIEDSSCSTLILASKPISGVPDITSATKEVEVRGGPLNLLPLNTPLEFDIIPVLEPSTGVQNDGGTIPLLSPSRTAGPSLPPSLAIQKPVFPLYHGPLVTPEVISANADMVLLVETPLAHIYCLLDLDIAGSASGNPRTRRAPKCFSLLSSLPSIPYFVIALNFHSVLRP